MSGENLRVSQVQEVRGFRGGATIFDGEEMALAPSP